MSGCRTPEQRAHLLRKMRAVWARKKHELENNLNRGPLVPWAKSKCEECGTTLASDYDVQTHLCLPMTPSRTRAIDPDGWLGGGR